jgi:hypothetical protein
MKTKFISNFILYFIAGFFSLSVSASDYQYDISQYYTPDITRNKLELDFKTNGNFWNIKRKFLPAGNFPNDSTRTGFFDGTLSPVFETYTNTRKRISTFRTEMNLNYSSLNQNTANTLNSRESINSGGYLNLSTIHTFYNSSNQFLSIGGSANLNLDSRKENTGNDSIYTYWPYDSKRLSISPTLGIGIGRIESVTDARQALFILDVLSEKGVLSRSLTNDEVFELSQEISKVKNKRFLDSRLHLINEIETVDSFFVGKNLLLKSNAAYFANLYDIWLYGDVFERGSGQKFETKLTPTYNMSNDTSSYITNFDNTWSVNENVNYGFSLSFLYNYEKPVNLKWQHSVNAFLSGYTNYQDWKNSTESFAGDWLKSISNGANFRGEYILGFYPDTRTNISAGISEVYQLNRFKNLNEPNSNIAEWDIINASITNFRLSATYYFSPQLSLQGNINFSAYNIKSKSVITNQFQGTFSASLKYSIF